MGHKNELMLQYEHNAIKSVKHIAWENNMSTSEKLKHSHQSVQFLFLVKQWKIRIFSEMLTS